MLFMIQKFTQFLNELSGYPNPIKPYVHFVSDICNQELDKYLSRKGKFANYNVKFEFDYQELKKHIPLMVYKDFPIALLEFTFKINVFKDIKEIDRVGMFYGIGDAYVDEIKSTYYYNPDVPDVTLGYRLVFEIGLALPYSGNSIEPEKAKELLLRVCDHEFTHSYEEIMNNRNEENMLSFFSNLLFEDKLAQYSEIYKFYYLLYYINKTEVRARVSEIRTSEIPKDLVKEIKELREFDVDKTLKKIRREMGAEKFKKEYEKFGSVIVDAYEIACDKFSMKPLTKMMNLKNKNMKDVFTYFKPLFAQTADYLERKLHKRLAQNID
jgi:hypothetical protein